jgi:thiosulfate/3-mercaptopyruvate sulfurtransferase
MFGGSVMAQNSNVAKTDVRAEMLVSTDWLASHLGDPELVVLCVAENTAFYGSHIPGARLIPLDQLVMQGKTLNAIPPVAQLKDLFESAGISTHSRIVIYGEKLGMLAARAFFTLDYLGLADRVALLDGGIEKWRADRRHESRQVPTVEHTTLEVHPNPDLVATFEQVRESSKRGDTTLIDARPTAEFTGEKRSEDVLRSGHIPGARGLYWQNLLTSREVPTLRPVSELKEAFRSVGARSGTEVVTYCRTGMQASFDYFVAKYLGYSARNYVSSFYEYSRKQTSVEESPRVGAVTAK